MEGLCVKWIKNSKSKPDAMLTFAFVAFIVVLLKYVVSDSSLVIKDFNVNFDDFDSGAATVLLTATLGSYVGRRWQDAKYKEPAEENVAEA